MVARLMTSLLFLLTVACAPVVAQDAGVTQDPAVRRHEDVRFGFWNLENLFDTHDDKSNPGDDEFLPEQGWTKEVYRTKLLHLAKVIAELDCHVLGLAEMENQSVLEDLKDQDAIRELGYEIVHVDSPDKRGIDMALLYRHPVDMRNRHKDYKLHRIPMDSPTRGILEVKLKVGDSVIFVLVNHWPSRRGGLAATEGLRKQLAAANRDLAKSLIDRDRERDVDIVIMGDLNDDPFDASVMETLGAIRNRHCVEQRTDKEARYRLYNPMWKFLGQPETGTLYYNSEWVWNVFDQIIVSRGLLNEDRFQLLEDTLQIYGPDYMRDQYRRPLRYRKNNRTGEYSQGYSDHFPVTVTLRRYEDPPYKKPGAGAAEGSGSSGPEKADPKKTDPEAKPDPEGKLAPAAPATPAGGKPAGSDGGAGAGGDDDR